MGRSKLKRREFSGVSSDDFLRNAQLMGTMPSLFGESAMFVFESGTSGRMLIPRKECSKASFKDSFPLLYKAAEELDAAVGEGLLSDNDLAILEKGLSNTMTEEELKRCRKGLETTLHMKKEFNELVHTKRAFKLSSSGFCVTLSGPAEATSVLCSETDSKRGDSAQRKSKTNPKVQEIRTRMRKTHEGRQTEVVTSTKSCTLNIQQAKIQIYDEMKAQSVERPKKSEENGEKASNDLDVDELVQIIEGTHIKSNDPNPKKLAKKARQKEKKEMERQRMEAEKAKEEEQRKAEELRLLEEEKRKEELERKRREEEEQRRKDEILRKQRELAEQKKEEQRKKRQEIERKKAEEKKQKKEAKKQRREQRKKEMDVMDEDCGSEKKSAAANESYSKTDHGKDRNRTPSLDVVSEKEYGRLKHEKEQRKREEEEARRIEQLQAQERSQANKKNKKKKKKSKQTDGQSQNANDPDNIPCNESPEPNATPSGQPLMEIMNTSKSDETQNKSPEDKNNLVTIKKHMDSSVTISMKGKEGESDLVYTLMNGQVYPTSVDGKIRTEAPLPLQHTTFVKQQDNSRPNHLVSVANSVNHSNSNQMGPVNSMKSPVYQAPVGGSPYIKENSGLSEIDLSQLKLPPGITITKVPQQMSGPRCEDMNGVQNHPDYQARPVGQPNMDYHRSGSVVGAENNRHNSNVMVVDSRCSSLESPVIGVRPSDMAFGANGTRPSSEASVASDRPSSGLDSLCNNNGSSPFVTRQGYPSSEMLNKRVPISLSSPFTTTSRNETPSPAWQNDMHPNLGGMQGVINHNSAPSADRHGFWSSTPASPVAFPANSVSESYLRAQDQQFIRPRPQPRGVYPPIGKRTSPSAGMCADGNLFARKAPTTDFKPIGGGVASNASPQYNQGPISVNGSTTPSNLGPIGYKPVIAAAQQKPSDQWTPWNLNADRLSPDVHPVSSQYVAPDIPLSLTSILSDDINGPWESTPIEKPPRQVNPFGPIGSNITRRSSNATSNGLHGKMSESSGSEDASLWAYNRTF